MEDVNTLFADVMIRGQMAQHHGVPLEMLDNLVGIDRNKLGPKVQRQYDELAQLARKFARERSSALESEN